LREIRNKLKKLIKKLLAPNLRLAPESLVLTRQRQLSTALRAIRDGLAALILVGKEFESLLTHGAVDRPKAGVAG